MKNGVMTMLLIKAIKKLKENFDELPTDNIQYKMGYATAIRDLRHIAEEEEEGDVLLYRPRRCHGAPFLLRCHNPLPRMGELHRMPGGKGLCHEAGHRGEISG